MQPYYSDKYVTIYHGDCRDILPDLPKVDLVLTDPPYGIGKMVAGSISLKRLHKTKYTMFEDSVEYVRSVVIPAIEMCLTMSDRMVVTTGSKCLNLYPKWDSMGCFYQPAGVGMQLWGSMDSQPIIYYGRPYDIGKRIHKCSYQLTEPPSCKEHPCSKPIKAWKTILSDRPDGEHLLLDPFLGSGTTLVAAKQLNRKAIGIELEEKYCEIAAKRCSQEVFDF